MFELILSEAGGLTRDSYLVMEKRGSGINIFNIMNKIDKIIIYGIFGSIPVGLFLFSIFSMILGPSTKQVIIERDLSENVNGVVDTLFDNYRNHDIRTAIMKNNQIFQILPEWESKIEIGDSLYKKKGSFLLEVYKRSGKKVVLDYRSTIKKE
jgi:hypothetical protein